MEMRRSLEEPSFIKMQLLETFIRLVIKNDVKVQLNLPQAC